MRAHGLMLLCLLLTAVGGVARAVEYVDGPPIGLRLQVSAYTAVPAQTVTISLSGSDTDYEMGANRVIRAQISDPVTLKWEATVGRLQQMTPGNNPAQLMWVAPARPGSYAIFVTADDSGRYADEPPVRQLIEIAVELPGATPAPALRVAANPQTIQLRRGSTSQITAQLLGQDVAGKQVRFFSTRGTLSATTGTTDANGLTSVRLTVSRVDIGTATVAAFYGATTATTTVEIVSRTPEPLPYPPVPPPPLPPGPNPPGFLVDVTPPTLPADGVSAAAVTVRLTDLRGVGIPAQIVIFRATMGSIRPFASMTDAWGYARAQIVAPTVAGTGLVIADSGAQRGYAAVTFAAARGESAGPPRAFLTVDPTTLMADGTSAARVEALVLDQDGRAMVDTAVTFSASLGTLKEARVVTDANGRAATTLTAPTQPGQGTVTAQVGQVKAASQITFQGFSAAGPSLEIGAWSGQQTVFVAERWLHHSVMVEAGGGQGGSSQRLTLIDAGGNILREILLAKNAILVRDQTGLARGYGMEDEGKAKLALLKPDLTPLRTVTMDLATGSHLVDARCAEPAGHLLVSVSQPDGTHPEVQLFSPDGTPLHVFREGLEALPEMALSGDGHLALALPGGTVRLYGPTGPMISEALRKDGLPAREVVIGPGAAWVAISSALEGQKEKKPRVTVFSRQGAEMAAFEVDARRMAPAGEGALAVATPERTLYLNIAGRRTEWSLSGGFERFLAVGGKGVIAGVRDAKTGELISRIIVVRLSDGRALATQDFQDFLGISAVLPPDEKGRVGVVAHTYALRFPLPKDN